MPRIPLHSIKPSDFNKAKRQHDSFQTWQTLFEVIVVAAANVILRVEASRSAGEIEIGLLCLQILMLFLERRLETFSI